MLGSCLCDRIAGFTDWDSDLVIATCSDEFQAAQSAFESAVRATEEKFANRDAMRGGAISIDVKQQTKVEPWPVNEGTEWLFRHWEVCLVSARCGVDFEPAPTAYFAPALY